MAWPKPTPGSPLKIPASLQGRLIDLATAPQRTPALPAPGGGSASSPYFTTVLAHNPTGTHIPALGVARAVGSAVDPGETGERLGQFLAMPVLELAHAGETEQGPLVIAANRIEAGGAGEVVIAGMIQTRIEVVDEAHVHAAPAAEAWKLRTSADPGGLVLVWREHGLGERWGLVLLGADARSAGSNGEPGDGGQVSQRPAIIVSSTQIGNDEWRYTCVWADTGATGATSGWIPRPDLGLFEAHNTSERVPFSGFDAEPIANGVGILPRSHQGRWYFSLSSVEGICSEDEG